ncbi:type II secretion system F family protein [Corallococcus exiguus]|uniref:type II secretion system F family protein n=1 Tax=Corallococcus TaxID=83461 RepID=UPI000EA11974|nr:MULTISPECIES: type II secretion system F family protein [Corallococcus]NNB90130.1 type II secretion system F family protein [Corallococcus exiguus]NNB98743.1 type II secretion system F family protein [Corallococcus exiguus]NNC20564.1 type II secretion system F family protein [Corallococcus exiguus]NPC50584.1 type II secretion system F family protein [Corallococcus exiguus]NRD57531.1 type II secretion system F family protein [Corallococcus exiguus]
MAAPAVQQKATASKKNSAQFLWEAKTKSGENKKGEMEAPDIEAVNARLKSLGLNPTKVRKKGALDGAISLPGMGGVTGKDILIFTRQFATMIDAGLPLVQCLDILASQMDNPAFKKVVFAIKSKVEQGSTFADALKEHPKIFDELYVQLCAAGEVGGILDTILNRLAAYREKSEKLKAKVKSAMTYPSVVILVAIGVTALLLLKVTPVFEKMFADFNSKLPAPTQVVVDMSKFAQAYFIHTVVGIAAVVFSFTWSYRQPKGRKFWDKVFLKMPLFGDVLRKVAVARFTRTLGTMISSGVPILDALDVTAKTAGNRTVEEAIYYVRGKIAEGKNIAGPLLETKVFPSMVVQMIGVGEATGAMDTMLNKIADFYDDEVDTAVSALTSMIEPLLMVFLGGVVGGFLIAMYLPIFSLAGAIK